MKSEHFTMNCLTSATIVVIFCILAVKGLPSPDNDTLVLVHVVFRHGDRTPDSPGYLNNPYNESFYQLYGMGQLTNAGRKTGYKIGTTLRQRYDRFLGPTWHINDLEAKTNNMDRTKMTLQVMLAGLYPPVGYQVWLPGLKWQPIPYSHSIAKELESTEVCSNFKTLYNALESSQEIQQLFSKYDDVYKYVSNKTGESFDTLNKMIRLFFSLTTQEEYGYPVESWWDPVFPDALEKITKDLYYLWTNTTDLKKISAGILLKKIINDSKAKIESLQIPTTRKMYIYSAREGNVATLLITLGVYEDKRPTYGSHVLVELHRINGVYGFKVYYQDWSTAEPRLMKLPGCPEFCPYDDFVALYADVVPDDSSC